MTSASESSRRDEGFGMVELLIALAIAAAVAVGLGGLLAYGSQLRDRTETASRIENSLAMLTALAAAIERLAALDPTQVGEQLFSLARTDATPGRLVVTITGRHVEAAVLDTGSDAVSTPETSRVNVSPFETVRLEYLAAGSTGEVAWTGHPRAAADVRAARLVVTRGSRSWAVVLWTRPRDLGAQS